MTDEHEGTVKFIMAITVTAINHGHYHNNSYMYLEKVKIQLIIAYSSFPLCPSSRWLCEKARTDTFLKIVNLQTSQTVWLHFAFVAVYLTRLAGYLM